MAGNNKAASGLAMRHLWKALAGLIVFHPLLCHAENDCPWMNKATASGILGGPVSVIVKSGSPGSAVCNFHSERSNTSYDLQIEVEGMKNFGAEFGPYKAACGPGAATPLQAIGNEAEMCSTNNSDAGNAGTTHGEKVVGRVRDRAFIVTVSTSAGNDPSMTKGALEEKAKGVAGQVAGSLF